MRRAAPLLLAYALAAADAFGQGAPPPKERADKTCGAPNAIAAIACEVAAALGDAAATSVVIAAPPRSDRALRDPSGLARRIATVVSGALGRGAAASTEVVTLPTAQALARTSGKLLFLEIAIEQGTLAVTAEVYSVKRGFWDRIRLPPAGPSAHAFSSRRLDGEVGHYLETPPLVFEKTSRVDIATG